ncbi:MAG: 2-amino-4-hydroxy-6-hydroxymethyldihydropteridine diphosphokinase [Acidimicrobiia bacterium]
MTLRAFCDEWSLQLETPQRAYLGIGSNLGDRVARLQGALDGLAATPDIEVVGVSPVYETAPVGGPSQPDYLNAVVGIDTTLAPRDLLVVANRLEAEADRVRQEHWGPRTLDVDVLLVDDEEVSEPDLVVPHPRMLERAFVLVPLADLDPAWEPWIPPEHAEVRPTDIRLVLPE